MKTGKADAKGSVKIKDKDGKVLETIKLPVISLETPLPETFAETLKLAAYKAESDVVSDFNAYYIIQIQNAGRQGGTKVVEAGERDQAKIATAMRNRMADFINGKVQKGGGGIGFVRFETLFDAWEDKANANIRKQFEPKMAEARKLQSEKDQMVAKETVLRDFYRAVKTQQAATPTA